MNPEGNTVTLPVVQWEMTLLEIHSLRTLLQGVVLRLELHVRQHPDARPLQQAVLHGRDELDKELKAALELTRS